MWVGDGKAELLSDAMVGAGVSSKKCLLYMIFRVFSHHTIPHLESYGNDYSTLPSPYFSNRNANRQEKGDERRHLVLVLSYRNRGPRMVFPPKRNMGCGGCIIFSLSKEVEAQQFPGHLSSANSTFTHQPQLSLKMNPSHLSLSSGDSGFSNPLANAYLESAMLCSDHWPKSTTTADCRGAF